MNNHQAIFWDEKGNEVISVTYDSLNLHDERTNKKDD
jgi:hypothetical protein